MARDDEGFLGRLLATFRAEADEHLKAMAEALAALEKNAAPEDRPALVERAFRAAHSLKGAARAVNRKDVEQSCQSLEGVFAALKSGRIEFAAGLAELLVQALDALAAVLGERVPGAGAARDPQLRHRLEAAARGAAPQPRDSASAGAGGAHDTGAADVQPPIAAGDAPGRMQPAPLRAAQTVRISAARLDLALRQAEDLLGPRLAARERVVELRGAAATLEAWDKERVKAAPAVRALGRGGPESRAALAKVLEYVEREAALATALATQLKTVSRLADRDQRALATSTERMLEQVREMQLLPAAALLEGFPRYARGLARERGKQVEVAIEGGAIEVNRRVLDEVRDPLVHILRNCVDHGIEMPEQRSGQGKPLQGHIAFTVSQEHSGRIEIRVTDDGAGIDAARVFAAARRLGAVAEGEEPSEAQALELVFRSGLTTSAAVTDVSGRGLGLAIVREKIERLGGAVTLESKPGAGTTFRIVLPLGTATYRGVLVRAAARLFALPTANVESAVRVPSAEVRTVENRATIALGGRAVSLVRLDDVLELARAPASGDAGAFVHAVVIASGAARIAFRVDETLGEQELLVKPLGPQLARVRNVAGASILGSGQLVPVLSASDLLKSALRRSSGAPAASSAEASAAARQRSILVVEDSITSRALLKNILESAGYRVATAVDGVEGYAALRSGEFDLLVSDVEMPRMDGFELTAKLRADKRLAELPVVLVTALGSREQRERGIEVGANAYLVKSSFEQSDLLEVVRRLL